MPQDPGLQTNIAKVKQCQFPGYFQVVWKLQWNTCVVAKNNGKSTYKDQGTQQVDYKLYLVEGYVYVCKV